MEYGGKKTERVRVALSEDIAREIRALAELECRDVQDQLRFILMRGLEHLRGNRGNRHLGERRAISGHAGTAERQAKDFQGHSVPSEAKPRQLLLGGTVGPVAARKRRAG